MNRKWLIVLAFVPLALALMAQESAPPPAQNPNTQKKARRPPPPGVSTPGVKREMTTIKPLAVFDAGQRCARLAGSHGGLPLGRKRAAQLGASPRCEDQ